jgi:uncharacterized protein
LKPAINCITLPVDDPKKSLAFYRDGLGLPAQFSAELEDGADCTAFELAGDLWLVPMPRAEFDKCTKIAHQPDAPRGSSECILSYFAASKEDVDAILKRANAAGGAVPGEAEDQPKGLFRVFHGSGWSRVGNHVEAHARNPPIKFRVIRRFCVPPEPVFDASSSRSSYGLGDPLTTLKQKCTLLYENHIKTDNTLCERADQRLEGLRKAGDD